MAFYRKKFEQVFDINSGIYSDNKSFSAYAHMGGRTIRFADHYRTSVKWNEPDFNFGGIENIDLNTWREIKKIIQNLPEKLETHHNIVMSESLNLRVEEEIKLNEKEGFKLYEQITPYGAEHKYAELLFKKYDENDNLVFKSYTVLNKPTIDEQLKMKENKILKSINYENRERAINEINKLLDKKGIRKLHD